MKTFVRLILIFIPLFISAPGSAQTAQRKQGSGASIPREGFGVITGEIHDAATKQAVEYCTVILFRSIDSSMVAGVSSDDKGRFLLEKIQPGKYYIRVQFIGYLNKFIPNLVVSDQNANIVLGDINLQPNTAVLSEVEVKAEKPMITNNLDKKVISVDKSMAIGGGTAVDIMQNVPSVTVDVDGNVSLRGNSNITLLIDGKPSSQAGLATSDVLNQIPASAIDNIEVITNPSVKYDPDGTSGIINIVLKKKSLQGFNGIVTGSAGTGDKYNGSMNLNYRQDKFNLFAGADGRINQSKTSMESTRTSGNNDMLSVLKQVQNGTFNRNMFSLNGGIDYLMNTRNNLTLSAQYRNMEFNSNSVTLNGDYAGNDSLTRYFDRTAYNPRTINATDYTLSYKHLFPQKGREFTNDLIYSDNTMSNTSKITQQDYTSPGGDAVGNLIQQQNTGNNNNKAITLQGNYVYPIEKNGRIEAGYKAAMRDMKMNFDYTNFNNLTGEWISQSSLKNQYDYKDQLYAVYGIYGNSIGKLKYQGGLRFEQVWINSNVTQTNTAYNSSYSSLYPSLHTEYDLGKDLELQLSYSRRVDRPSPWQLNPYINYTDSLSIQTGNPALKPDYTNSLELGTIKYWNKNSLTTTLFYHNTNNVVQNISRIQDSVQKVIITMPMNINHQTSYGLEIVGDANPNKWMKISANISLYRNMMGALPIENLAATDQFSWTSRLNMTFIPWKNSSLQLIGTYNSPSRTVQLYRKEQYYADASFRQDLWKNKLSLSLRLTDIFNTHSFNDITYGNGFTTDSNRYRESRVLYVGMQLKLNNYNKKPPKDPTTEDNDDMEEY